MDEEARKKLVAASRMSFQLATALGSLIVTAEELRKMLVEAYDSLNGEIASDDFKEKET
jgi:hypothetical protein